MNTIENIQALKKRYEEAKQQRERAQGAFQQALTALKAECGVVSRNEAEKRLRQLQADYEAIQEEVEKRTQEFSKKWGSVL